MHDYESAVARFGADKTLKKVGDVESVCCIKFDKGNAEPPILTIGIPVYNGHQAIYRTLTSVYSSLQTLADRNRVEIVICDNASTDRTSEAIHEFFNEKSVRGGYFRHVANLGLDSNLDSIVKFGSGDYVWFVGCGDEVKPNAIGRLVEKLSQISVANLLLDFDRYSESDATLIQKREHPNNADLIIEGRDDFSRPRYAPALSANVIKREKWLACLNEEFITSGWGHVERILKILSRDENSSTAILAFPFFTLFIDKKGWWTKPDGYKLHLAHIRVIQSMVGLGFRSSAANCRLHELNGAVLIRSVLGAKKYGYRFSVEDMNEIRAYCRSSLYPLVVLGLSMPPRLAGFIFSDSKWKVLGLGFRKIYKRFLNVNKA